MWFDNATGWWMPDGDTHFHEYMVRAKRTGVGERLGYQVDKFLAAMRAHGTRKRTVAVDVGAHIGTWSYTLAHYFLHVHAFEPVPEFARCWRANVSGGTDLAETALGYYGVDSVRINREVGNSGKTSTTPAASGALCTALDAYEMTDVDFLKIDVEGGELDVIRGGEATIRRGRPTIIVEEHVRNGPAVALLRAWGYVVRHKMTSDYIMVHSDV